MNQTPKMILNARKQPDSPAKHLENLKTFWEHRSISLRGRRLVMQQLARLVMAGIPLVQAIAEISAASSNRRVRVALDKVRSALDKGDSLAVAVATAPEVFDESDVGLIGLGERTGNLSAVLERRLGAINRMIETRQRIISAVAYPVFLFLTGFFIMPLPSLISCGFAGYLREALVGPMILAGIVVFWVIGKMIVTRLGLGPNLRIAAWKIPGISLIYGRRITADFLENLTTAISAGLGLPETLATAAKATRDPLISQTCNRAIQLLEKGESFATALVTSGLFDDRVNLALVSGERTGSLDDSLKRLSVDLDAEFLRFLTIALKIVGTLILLSVMAYTALKILTAFAGVMGGADSESMKILDREIPGLFNTFD